jgi:hypothetical protein
MLVPNYGHLDLKRPNKDIVLDLLYITNDVKFYLQRSALGEPTALDTRPSVDWDENTVIYVTVDTNADPSDDTTGLYPYRRLSFGEVGLRTLPPSLAGQKVHDVLPQINQAHKLNLTIDDVSNDTIPDGGIFYLKATKGSLVWQGKVLTDVSDSLLKTLELDCFKEYAA